jgi:hypothetical protein
VSRALGGGLRASGAGSIWRANGREARVVLPAASFSACFFFTVFIYLFIEMRVVFIGGI